MLEFWFFFFGLSVTHLYQFPSVSVPGKQCQHSLHSQHPPPPQSAGWKIVRVKALFTLAWIFLAARKISRTFLASVNTLDVPYSNTIGFVCVISQRKSWSSNWSWISGWEKNTRKCELAIKAYSHLRGFVLAETRWNPTFCCVIAHTKPIVLDERSQSVHTCEKKIVISGSCEKNTRKCEWAIKVYPFLWQNEVLLVFGETLLGTLSLRLCLNHSRLIAGHGQRTPIQDFVRGRRHNAQNGAFLPAYYRSIAALKPLFLFSCFGLFQVRGPMGQSLPIHREESCESTARSMLHSTASTPKGRAIFLRKLPLNGQLNPNTQRVEHIALRDVSKQNGAVLTSQMQMTQRVSRESLASSPLLVHKENT